jgi:hypothetical protein
MHDYGELVYLDVQKTGSTFVVEFLEASCRLPRLGGGKHSRITGVYRTDAYYFATVRHPVAQYVSLFRYGAEGKGFLRENLEKAGRTDLYENGIDHWLAYVLDPETAPVFRENFDRVVATGIGLMTFRFVVLSLAHPMRSLKSAQTVEDVRAIYDAHRLTRSVIRTEELNDGLRRLAFDEHPEWFDADAATRFLAAPPVNVSRSPPPPPIDPTLAAEIIRRERILLDLFYPGGPG